MNVYDFDKTIFYPDSSVTFVKWEMKRHPLIFLRCLPVALWHGLLYLLKIMSKEQQGGCNALYPLSAGH